MLFEETTGIDLESVYEMIERADEKDSGISRALVEEARRGLQRANSIYDANPLLAAEACRTAFQQVRILRFALASRQSVVEANAVKNQRKKAGFSSGKDRLETRKPTWDLWQKAVDRVRKETPTLKRSRVYEIVALEHGVTRQAVGKRVVWK